MNQPRFTATALASLALAGSLAAATRDVTFLSTSDSHYRADDCPLGNHNDLNRASVDEMNRITTVTWPEKLGGGPISAPRGVLVLGDNIDDGDRMQGSRNLSGEQWSHFTADFGLDGHDGRLHFPVFEGWGNHDGPPVGAEKHFSTQAKLKERTATRLKSHLVSRVSPNGLHYSWDWDDVHFVQLNIYPADQQNPHVRYARVWHNPQDALSFLKDDLAASVGHSGRPVVLMSHCGFDTDWWNEEDWRAVYDAARSYHVVLYLYGHSGTGVHPWAPPGEEHKWDCVNDGQTAKGFFVVQITGNHLRLAMRLKEGVEYKKGPDHSTTHTWDGRWGWKWTFERNLDG